MRTVQRLGIPLPSRRTSTRSATHLDALRDRQEAREHLQTSASPDLDRARLRAVPDAPAALDPQIPRLEHQRRRAPRRELEADRTRAFFLAVTLQVREHRVERLHRQLDGGRRERGRGRELPEAAQP
ncbi:MAG: hypothetical protein MUE69_03725, partial [Myxococcota bacterium]|nr:hypothetical protein [Myxococcota bacterium]